MTPDKNENEGEFEVFVPFEDGPIHDPGSPFDGVTGITRHYGYLPYTHHRIKQIMRDLGIEMMWMHPYKCGRYHGYKRRYKLLDIETGEAISETWFSNDDLRYFLAQMGFPLEVPKATRNRGAEQFLAAVAEAERMRRESGSEK